MTLTGVNKYTIVVTDKAGNVAKASIEIVPKPEVTTTPNIANGQTTNKDVVITVVRDNTTMKINGSEYGGSYTANEDGNYFVEVTDIYQSKTQFTFAIDKSMPNAPTLTANTTKPTKNNVTITATAPKTVSKIEYKVGEFGEVKTYTDGITLEDNDTVYAWAITDEGVTSAVASLEVTNIDKDAPVIKYNTTVLDGKTSAKSVTATAEDVGIAGIASVIVIDEEGNMTTSDDNSVTLTQRGKYTIKATDIAGNVVTETIELVDTITIKTVPTIINNQVQHVLCCQL